MDKRLSNEKINNNTYKTFKISNQIPLIVISISLIPAIIFGYLLYASVTLQIQFTNIYIHLTFVIILSIITIAATLYESTQSIKSSLKTIQNALHNLEKGNILSDSIPILNKNEFGEICMYIDSLNNSIKEKVKILKDTSNNVIRGIEEIKTSSDSLSTSSSEQAASVEEISSSMEHVTSNIVQNTEHAHTTNKIAQKTSEGANNGESSINDTLNAIKKITDKILLIEDLTNKTDLLSLNASIEAARAGEHGKGFSVVASEVKKLAEIIGAVALAGEISLGSAISSTDWVSSHETYGRNR